MRNTGLFASCQRIFTNPENNSPKSCRIAWNLQMLNVERCKNASILYISELLKVTLQSWNTKFGVYAFENGTSKVWVISYLPPNLPLHVGQVNSYGNVSAQTKATCVELVATSCADPLATEASRGENCIWRNLIWSARRLSHFANTWEDFVWTTGLSGVP